MNSSAKFQEAASAHGAGADHITNAQAGVARSPGDQLWEAVIDVLKVTARDLLAINTGQHGHVVTFASILAVTVLFQFIRCHQAGAERGSEILALAGAEIELHI